MDVLKNFEKVLFGVEIGDVFEHKKTGAFYILCKEGYKYKLINFRGKGYFGEFESIEEFKNNKDVISDLIHYSKEEFVVRLEKV